METGTAPDKKSRVECNLIDLNNHSEKGNRAVEVILTEAVGVWLRVGVGVIDRVGEGE
jgi:hypothetical protein